MSDSETVVLADRLVSRTETYLDQTEACVAALPELLATYPDGNYGEFVDRISTLESDCDRTNRRLCRLVADADVRDLGIRLTGVHLHASQTIELFNALDEVANATEQFAVDLGGLRPALPPDRRDLFDEMAAEAARAMTALRTAVTEYVAVLCNPEGSADIANEVARVRDAESTCDRLRNQVVTLAFDGDSSEAAALVCRALVTQLDEVVDAMEDVTDRMVRTTGSELAVDAEPESPRR